MSVTRPLAGSMRWRTAVPLETQIEPYAGTRPETNPWTLTRCTILRLRGSIRITDPEPVPTQTDP